MRRLVLLAVALAPALASAQYFYLPFKMVSSQAQPFPVYVDGRYTNPAGLSVSAVQQAAEHAWATWNAVSCAAPKVAPQGLTTAAIPRPDDPYDLYSVTPVWVLSSSDPDYQMVLGSPYVVAQTLPLSYAGVLQACDTFFNGADYAWAAASTTPAGSLDVETVMLHEAGHCLGLDHFGNSNNIMSRSVEVGQDQRSLGPDDIQALCQANPASGAPGAPCLADGGCEATNLLCLSQVTNQGTVQRCASGCVTGTGAVCDAPLTCQPSSAFSPSYNGACLLPGTSVTEVGKPCAQATDCGSSTGACQQPQPAPSGQQFWVDGYCMQSCLPGQPECPAGSLCVAFSASQQECLKSCRVGLADCRPEYACAQTAGGGVCIPRCYADSDCSDPVNYTCRTCDGLCVARQNASAQVGDICSTDANCGAGQVCLALDAHSGTKQCVLQCGRGCGSCPTGSACLPTELGDLYCLRTCSGPGTCPSGLRCGDLPAGHACVPTCSTSIDCPVGQVCQGGDCITPSTIDDGGCALCTVPDAGHAIPPPHPDAGTGTGGGTAGCGCQSGASGPGLLLGAWALLAALRRRRRAP